MLNEDQHATCMLLTHCAFPPMEEGRWSIPFSHFDSGWLMNKLLWFGNEMSKCRMAFFNVAKKKVAEKNQGALKVMHFMPTPLMDLCCTMQSPLELQSMVHIYDPMLYNNVWHAFCSKQQLLLQCGRLLLLHQNKVIAHPVQALLQD